MSESSLLQSFAAALLAAFPTRADLVRAVEFGLSENLNALTAEAAGLTDTVFILVQWAEAQGRLGDLLTAALAANPGNLQLQALRAQWPVLAAGGLFGVPYYPNAGFIGREEELARLHELLQAGELPALTGTGGIGKTQLAVEYAHRYRAAYLGGVFWLRMDPPAGIAGQVVTLAGPDGLRLPGWDAAALEANVALVRRAWDQPAARLLLIFDNLEDPTVLKEWRPKPGSGSRLLITSRYHLWASRSGITRQPLAALARPASRELLLGETARATGHSVAALLADSATAVETICEELGDLPLALALAGAYLMDTGLAPAAYLARLRAVGLDHDSLAAAKLDQALPTGHAPSLAATFALSYDQLQEAAPTDALALCILHAAAACAPAPIPWHLLTRAAGLDPDDMEAQETAAAAGKRLAGLGLLAPWPAAEVSLHRLLAAYVRTRAHLSANVQAALEQALIDELYTINMAGYPQAGQPYLAHARHLADLTPTPGDTIPATLLTNLGYLLNMQGDYAGARPYYERAIAISETALGSTHELTALRLNNLANLLSEQGDYAVARPLLERALAIREAVRGPAHPTTAQSLGNLARLLYAQGDYTAARPLLERARAIHEQVLGLDHPDTATSLNNLANLLYAQGDYAAARPLLERALAIREAALGPTHPDTTISILWIATLAQQEGDYAAARPLFDRALVISEENLGPAHPTTAISLNNLARLLYAQGDYTAARPLLERALAIREAALGPAHPDTATSLNNLARLLQDQGDYVAARPLFERALAIREAALGPTHPDTAQSLWWLATLAQQEGDTTTARPLLERALAIFERALGAKHPDTRNARAALEELTLTS